MAPSLPKTYKAAIFKEANGPLVLEDVELKQPEAGHILIKVLATGVCHSDMAVKTAMMTSLPRVPGHESIGDVVAVGPGEKKWKIGDRVGAAWHGGHDEICKSCNRGLFQCCDNEEINGITRDGGYAEYCDLRSEAAVRIPTDLDPAEAAPLLCAGVTVFNGIRNQKITPGEIVGVQGLGGLGHLAVQYAAKMGYRVVALSSSASKEKFAKELGASDYVDGSKKDAGEVLQEMGGAAMIVCTAPNPTVMKGLIHGLAPMGKLLILAVAGEATFDTIPMIQKGLSVQCWPSGHALDCEEGIDFAKLHGVKCMVERFPLAKANDAFAHMESGKVRFRSVLTME